MPKYLSLLFFQFLSFESVGEEDGRICGSTLQGGYRETAPMMKGRKLDTIYIGGGTPTTLAAASDQRKLLDTVGEVVSDYEGLAEFTIEAGQTGQYYQGETARRSGSIRLPEFL